ncbi:MAG: hypothetical protein IIB90_05955 [Gemmatimonadetes bacterium]|nr:hypothetical protein [Gemmatimonadota bacterium]
MKIRLAVRDCQPCISSTPWHMNAARLASGLGVSGQTVSWYLDLLVDLLEIRESIVIYPGQEAIPLGEGTVAMGLHGALEWIRERVAG